MGGLFSPRPSFWPPHRVRFVRLPVAHLAASDTASLMPDLPEPEMRWPNLSAAPARFLFQWGGLLAALKLRSSSTKLRRRQVASESYSSPHLHLARILASRFVGSGIASLLSLCSYLIIPNRYGERGCFHGRVCSDEPPSRRLGYATLRPEKCSWTYPLSCKRCGPPGPTDKRLNLHWNRHLRWAQRASTKASLGTQVTRTPCGEFLFRPFPRQPHT